jgi:hypothetical protein
MNIGAPSHVAPMTYVLVAGIGMVLVKMVMTKDGPKWIRNFATNVPVVKPNSLWQPIPFLQLLPWTCSPPTLFRGSH